MIKNKGKFQILFCGIIIVAIILGLLMWNLYTMKKDISLKLEENNTLLSQKESFVDILIDDMGLRFEPTDTNIVRELPWLTTERSFEIKINNNTNYKVWFDNIELSEEVPLEYTFTNLSPEHNIPVKIVDNISQKETSFIIKTWPDGLPTYHTAGCSPIEGDYYITPLTSEWGAAYKVGEDGNLKYYRYSAYKSYHDFKKIVTDKGKIRYLLFESYEDPHKPNAFTTAGCYIVYDQDYHELKRITMEKTENIFSDNWPLDQHDILYLNDSEYYIFAYVEKYVNNIPDNVEHRENGALVVATIIQGFKNGKLFFEWDSTEHPELYAYSVEYNDYLGESNLLADYMHANSIDKDVNDGNIIVSFRDLDSIIKIDVKNNNIIWILGGKGDQFHLTEEQKFSKQHYARYNYDGSITLFDNGNKSEQTRVVRIWLDEKERVVKNYASYENKGYYSSATGSTQLLSEKQDIYCIGWGVRTKNLADNYPNMSEINFTTGETYFSFTFDNPDLQTYRCVKYK